MRCGSLFSVSISSLTHASSGIMAFFLTTEGSVGSSPEAITFGDCSLGNFELIFHFRIPNGHFVPIGSHLYPIQR